jgi:hypothetical protein
MSGFSDFQCVGRLWSLWAKVRAVGDAQALSTASVPVRRRRIVHKSTARPLVTRQLGIVLERSWSIPRVSKERRVTCLTGSPARPRCRGQRHLRQADPRGAPDQDRHRRKVHRVGAVVDADQASVQESMAFGKLPMTCSSGSCSRPDSLSEVLSRTHRTRRVNSRPDWPAIERDYREGRLSLRQLAIGHCCSHSTIANKARRDGWRRDPMNMPAVPDIP